MYVLCGIGRIRERQRAVHTADEPMIGRLEGPLVSRLGCHVRWAGLDRDGQYFMHNLQFGPPALPLLCADANVIRATPLNLFSFHSSPHVTYLTFHSIQFALTLLRVLLLPDRHSTPASTDSLHSFDLPLSNSLHPSPSSTPTSTPQPTFVLQNSPFRYSIDWATKL